MTAHGGVTGSAGLTGEQEVLGRARAESHGGARSGDRATSWRASVGCWQRGQRVRSRPVKRWSSAAQVAAGAATRAARAAARRASNRCASGSRVGTCRGANRSAVANLHEAAREDVEEKAPEELVRRQRDACAVLGPKRHGIGGHGDEPLIGEADAVGVAAEVLEEPRGAAERAA